MSKVPRYLKSSFKTNSKVENDKRIKVSYNSHFLASSLVALRGGNIYPVAPLIPPQLHLMHLCPKLYSTHAVKLARNITSSWKKRGQIFY